MKAPPIGTTMIDVLKKHSLHEYGFCPVKYNTDSIVRKNEWVVKLYADKDITNLLNEWIWNEMDWIEGTTSGEMPFPPGALIYWNEISPVSTEQ